MVSISDSSPTCPVLFARTFGISLNILMNSFCDHSLDKYRHREWYQKTVDTLAVALKKLSETIQFNSLDEILVSSSLSSQLPKKGSRAISIKEVRRKMNIKIRQRKNDTLVRCSACFGLKSIIEKSVSDTEKIEAKRKLDDHYKYISQQRVLIETLCSQSRDDSFDSYVFLIDGMSNKHTKLPRLCDRPKFVGDAVRVTMSLTTVQLAASHGMNGFTNFDYPSLQTVYPHDSSFILSLLLDGLAKSPSIASTLTLVLDSAPNNKCYTMIGGLAVILSKITALQKIYVLYPCTGHTHLSVDGHFGTLSRSLASKDLLDPKGLFCLFTMLFSNEKTDLTTFLESSPAVAEVNPFPTVYEFSSLQPHMTKLGNLCTNSQICLSKDKTGIIHWSCATSMHSSLLFRTDSNETAFRIFQELFKQGGSTFSEENRSNFLSFVNNYGKKSFRQTIIELNRKTPKVIFDTDPGDDSNDPHITVLEYLKNHGYPTGKMPKTPVFK